MELNPIERQATSSKERQAAPSKDGSLYLALGGWTVILSAVTSLVFSILPPKLGQPVWQLNAISALLGASANILIGSLLISLAKLVNPKDSQLRKNAIFIRKLAGFIAVLMVVLIPFSLFAGSRAIKANEVASNNVLKEWKKQLRAVQSLDSEADIRSWAASLPQPPLLPPVFDAPFPVIKNRLIDNLTGKVNSVQNQIEENLRGQWLGFLPDFARNSIQALLMAMGFSALSTEGLLSKFLLSTARNMGGLGPNQ
jgi:hypothetical protein